MKHTLTHIDPMSLAKFYAISISVMVGIFFLPAFLLSLAFSSDQPMAVFAIVAGVIGLISMAIFSFVIGLVYAFLFNLMLKLIGGLKFETKSTSTKTPPRSLEPVHEV